MSDDDRQSVTLRVHLRSAPEAVYLALSTAEGRAKFWAESAEEHDGVIAFRLSNGMTLESRVLSADPPRAFAVTYFGGSEARFTLAGNGEGGTDLTLAETGIDPQWWAEHRAGWVSVLLTLKAAVDFGVDLRNPDPARDWDSGYADV
ncbi:MAG TPA: SRPBCC domain-containing protein [bacterium]|nr:SRPBCC domain-containing protein [bacterium]